MDPILEHAEKIERLRQIDPETILETRLNSLLQAIRNQELKVKDVLQFTNISADQLQLLLDQNT